MPTYASLSAVFFVRAVPEKDFDAFRSRRLVEGAAGFDRDYEPGQPHYVIDYVQPDRTIQGVDLFPLESRRVPMERARDAGTAVASDWFVRVQDLQKPESEQHQIFGIYLPVYEGGKVPSTVDGRRDALLGWAVTNGLDEGLMHRLMPENTLGHGRLDLYAGSTANDDTLVTQSVVSGEELASESLTWVVRPFGNDWTLAFTPSQAQLQAASQGFSPVVLFTVVLLSALLPALFIWWVGSARQRAENRAEQAMAALRRSEKSMQTLAHTVPVAIFDLDERQRVRFTNQAWDELTDGPRGASALPWLPNLHTDDAAQAFMDWQLALANDTALAARYRLLLRGDEVRWVELTAVPILDSDGEVKRIIGCLVDVSAVVEFEREVSHARDEAEAASQLKSSFLANVSHEVRTPLNGVLGLAQLLLQDDLSAVQRERVQALHGAGSYLLELVNEILDFSKIEAGEIHFENLELNLSDFLAQLQVMFSATARDQGIRFAVEVDREVPTFVQTDPTRLRQVVGNLISNALKFTTSGSVTLSVHAIGFGLNADRLRFEVQDTGIGIPESEHQRIFDPFTQADGSTTRRFGGTGLGLAICAEVVELMGGQIGVTSEPGVGSTFWFTLPLATTDVHQSTSGPVLEIAAETPALSSGITRGGPDGLRILLVEDNLINQMVAGGLLESLGCAVTVASDGVEALEMLSDAAGFDMIFMDCQMPRMDGFTATGRIRGMRSSIATVPIVALTASSLAEDRQRCLDAGMNDVVSKPIRREELEAALRLSAPA